MGPGLASFFRGLSETSGSDPESDKLGKEMLIQMMPMTQGHSGLYKALLQRAVGERDFSVPSFNIHNQISMPEMPDLPPLQNISRGLY